MKFYETTFDEHIQKVKETNLHPELDSLILHPSSHQPRSLSQFSNAIFYGPEGVGKYSQALVFLSQFSPSQLRHTRKLVIEDGNSDDTSGGVVDTQLTSSTSTSAQSQGEVVNDKSTFPTSGTKTRTKNSAASGGSSESSTGSKRKEGNKKESDAQTTMTLTTSSESESNSNIILRMSDIHYEVNMSFLNKNARIIWHKIHSQIAEQNRECVILCREFQAIPVDLLSVFYSYMQHNFHNSTSNRIHYILLTDTTGFIPESIVNMCHLVRFIRPMKKLYEQCVPQLRKHGSKVKSKKDVKIDTSDISNIKTLKIALAKFQGNENGSDNSLTQDSYFSFRQLSQGHKPICNIILRILNAIASESATKTTISPVLFSQLREKLYDMLVYDLNIGECMWYIVQCILKQKSAICTATELPLTASTNILHKLIEDVTHFFQYYNQHYRPIYHLENLCMKFVQTIKQ